MSTLICRITLDKKQNEGITIYVENGEEITQTIQMDGTKIEIINKKNEDIQKITMDESSIVSESSQGENKSTVTQNFGDVKISCNNFTIEAKQKISLTAESSISTTGGSTSIKSDTSLDLQGQTTSIKGDATSSLQGGETTVKASTALTLEGGAESTLKGSMVNVQGTLIKIG